MLLTLTPDSLEDVGVALTCAGGEGSRRRLGFTCRGSSQGAGE